MFRKFKISKDIILQEVKGDWLLKEDNFPQSVTVISLTTKELLKLRDAINELEERVKRWKG